MISDWFVCTIFKVLVFLSVKLQNDWPKLLEIGSGCTTNMLHCVVVALHFLSTEVQLGMLPVCSITPCFISIDVKLFFFSAEEIMAMEANFIACLRGKKDPYKTTLE